MASGYQYTPLPVDGSSIRLLKLLPSPTTSSIIECEILTTSLADPSTHVSYEALSYTWGDAHPTTEIKLNGHTFDATINLGAALRALRRPDTPRVLWVDAVCIDQRNIPEQGAQVRMMWDIYRAAACVVVWLGPEEGNSAVAMADFARRETQTRLALRQRPMDEPRGNSDDRWCGCHAGDFETMPPRIGVQNLLGRRWFTRVWVLQEVAAAKRVVVACGSNTVDGGDFCREILGVASFSTSFNKILRKIRPAVQLMDSSYSGLHRGQLPLLELIETYRSWDATKAVDKVYSLLAFSSDGAAVPELQPDYSLPPRILAQRIVQSAFPTCVIKADSDSQDNSVTFEIPGLVLGKISGKMSGGGARRWTFHARRYNNEPDWPQTGIQVNQRVVELFQDFWDIELQNERRLDSGNTTLVCLLRGATRPTVLYYDEETSEYSVAMLATPEPIQSEFYRRDGPDRTWSDILSTLSTETEGLSAFTLTWDPFRAPRPTEVSRWQPRPNDVQVQWEAMAESLRDKAIQAKAAGRAADPHNCHTMTALWSMFRSEDEKEKIKAGTSDFTMTLHKAAYLGYYGTAQLLIDANADVNEQIPIDDSTPLHFAAVRGHADIVRALLAAGATLDVRNKSERTPLAEAVANGHVDVSAMLIAAGADPKLRDVTGSHMLFAAAVHGNREIFDLLVAAGADVNAKEAVGPVEEVAALHLAAELGRKDIVEALLAAGAQVDVRTGTDTTPLHQAAMNGHIEVVRVLLDHGADMDARDDNGVTPLDFALHRGQEETARELILLGAETQFELGYGSREEEGEGRSDDERDPA